MLVSHMVSFRNLTMQKMYKKGKNIVFIISTLTRLEPFLCNLGFRFGNRGYSELFK